MSIDSKNIAGANPQGGEKLIGFARIFSGTVVKGMKVFLITEG